MKVRLMAVVALLITGGSLLAAAQDVFSSGGSNTGQWNLGGPQICQKHVAQYNELTPQIQAAAKARNTETMHDLSTQREEKKKNYQGCVEANSGLLLQGKATENAVQQTTIYEEYGKQLPAMIGTADYKSVTLTVKTARNRQVGQGFSGPVKLVSKPRKFSRAEGFIESSSQFRITKLWDVNKRLVSTPVEGIPVTISPK
jgi:hypothetical protein